MVGHNRGFACGHHRGPVSSFALLAFDRREGESPLRLLNGSCDRRDIGSEPHRAL